MYKVSKNVKTSSVSVLDPPCSIKHKPLVITQPMIGILDPEKPSWVQINKKSLPTSTVQLLCFTYCTLLDVQCVNRLHND
jgi:hypothetical protein